MQWALIMRTSGVDKYTEGKAVISVYFWDGVLDCRHCPYIGTNAVLDACYCKLTGTYVDKSNLRKRADDCPVIFEKEDV
jgi:hypothetical protein